MEAARVGDGGRDGSHSEDEGSRNALLRCVWIDSLVQNPSIKLKELHVALFMPLYARFLIFKERRPCFPVSWIGSWAISSI